MGSDQTHDKVLIENYVSNICCTVACIRCSVNLITEPLPSNDMLRFTYRPKHIDRQYL
jgi:hypothetical protein